MIRLKRFPLLAALCILTVRGSLINLGFLLDAKNQMVEPIGSRLVAAVVAFPEAQVWFCLFFDPFTLWSFDDALG